MALVTTNFEALREEGDGGEMLLRKGGQSRQLQESPGPRFHQERGLSKAAFQVETGQGTLFTICKTG